MLTDWGMAMGIFAVDDMAASTWRGACGRSCTSSSEPGARKPLVADRLVRDGPARPEDRQGLVSLRRATASRCPIPRCVALIERSRDAAGIARRTVTDEEIRRARALRADQRGRARARGGHRAARRRHRRHLPDRLRLPRAIAAGRCSTPTRRPARRSTTASRRSTASTASAGRRRRCSRGWRATGSTFREFDAARRALTRRAAMRSASTLRPSAGRRHRRPARPDGVVYLQSRRTRSGRIRRASPSGSSTGPSARPTASFLAQRDADRRVAHA